MIRALSPVAKKDWPRHLQTLTFLYNCTIHETTHYAPFFLMFGRVPRIPVDILFSSVLHDSTVSSYDNLSGCRITEEGCAALVSALKSNPSHLRELNLNYNNPGEAGVKLLSDLLEDPHCKLEKLQCFGCGLVGHLIRTCPSRRKEAGASEGAGDPEPEAAEPVITAPPEADGSVPGEPALNVEVAPLEEGPGLPAAAASELAEAPGRVQHADATAGPAVEVQRPDTVRDTHGDKLQDGCSEPAEE
ncbi:hypothetical protein NFI96_006346 [Prochilodus magdalenae]|nr:hypothetical protein NFI96_006346 [Prochilodus magdalenae]